MAISQRVQILSDKSAELSVLAEYLKNPKLIDQLADDVRKLNALTDQETAKAIEARQSIALHEATKKDLSDKMAKIDSDRTELSLSVRGFNDHKEETLKQFSEKEAELSSKSSQLSDAIKSHAKNVSQLEKDRSELNSKHLAAMAELDKVKLAVAKTSEANTEKAAQLAEMQNSLKEKAGKLNALLTE